MSLFCRHQWVLVEARRIEDVSFGKPGIKQMELLRRCDRCSKVKVKTIDGWWNPENLQ